jgi:hypothetical protein
VIIDTDPHFFESDKRILNLPDFLSKYAKVVMLVIYLLVFMVNLDIFDKKYQNAPSNIKYYQQFKNYIKSNRISSITSTLLIETIDYLHVNNIDEAFRLIKHYLYDYVQMCDRDELDTKYGLKKWLLHVFNLSAPVPTPTLSNSSLLNINNAISAETQTCRRTRNSIDTRKLNRKQTLVERRNIDNVVAKHDTNWLSDMWGQWYIPDNTPKEPLSSVWRIVNRGGGSRRRGRPIKMNSQKKHLNKRTHKTINARTSKSNAK